MESGQTHPFERLTPGLVMDAVESRGYVCDCRTLALNSYENRVYQVGVEDGAPLVAKFYRPGRWSDEQIREEHDFCLELAALELPVVAPLIDGDGQSLFSFEGFRFALYPRKGGHAPELDNLDNLEVLGRLMGRIHRAGRSRAFSHRPRLDVETFGRQSVEFIAGRFIPAEYRASYLSLTENLLRGIEDAMERAAGVSWIRTHGDCHGGNMLWRDGSAHFVDFDDARMAPAVQDLWMLLSGDRSSKSAQLSRVIEGYSDFCEFNPRELLLVEALRTLRMLHYSAWLARRWDDPAFPHHFPWFNSIRYWGDHILELREQLAALDEPALEIW